MKLSFAVLLAVANKWRGVRMEVLSRVVDPLSEVLPPLSVGEMTLRLYAALNYSQNSAHDLRRTVNGA